MARHKQIKTEGEEDPEMNISSMIDCCFLLLIYFLVATSLVSEKKLDISIPGDSTASGGEPPKLLPCNIIVNQDGSVLWKGEGGEPMQVGAAYDPATKPGTQEFHSARKMSDLVENLKAFNETAKQVQEPPIVVVKSSPKAVHQRVMDVMSALAEAGIHTVGLSSNAE